ncbi:hypothetical protein [Pseudomonas phage PIP]|nr:hypothetical protein [Pseudomonas phage PIP]
MVTRADIVVRQHLVIGQQVIWDCIASGMEFFQLAGGRFLLLVGGSTAPGCCWTV